MRFLLSGRHMARWLGLAAWAVAGAAAAATYYVDADVGDDTKAGTLALPAADGSNAPWRTLARVNAAALQPGDQVLLKCGQGWNEPLVLMRGGTSSARVTIGSFPAGCSSKPAISGWQTIQNDDWEIHSGSIIKVRFPQNQIYNGRMSNSVYGWRTYSPISGQTFELTSSACPGGGSCGMFVSSSAGGLLISPELRLNRGTAYTVRMQVWAPAGARMGFMMRRFAYPYEAQSAYNGFLATGAWQDITFQFVAPNDLVDGRLDIDVPGNFTKAYFRNVRLESDFGSLKIEHVAAASGTMNPAAHPNIGFKSASPSSPYLSAAISNYVLGSDGTYGSTYVSTGSDLVLPTGASLTAGLDVWIRSQAWSVKRHKVTSVSGSRVNLDSQTAYPLIYPGWGYFFTGALWMLDTPGEWFYDSSSKTLYAWMPTVSLRGVNRLYLGTLSQAVKIGDPTTGQFPGYITLDNLAIRGSAQGILASRMTGITLSNLLIEEINGYGVYAENAPGLTVTNSVIRNTRNDALFAYGTPDSTITNNDITNSGVIVDSAGAVKSLPRENFSAVMTGDRALVSGNRINNAGYIGIQAWNNAVISGNLVRNFSLILNDSGGLYSAGTSGQQIIGNTVSGGVGSRDGIPTVIETLAPAVYLDDNTRQATLSGNVFGDADYCIKLHNAWLNTLSGNGCFAPRRDGLFLQETSSAQRAAGDIYGNVVTGNAWFKNTPGNIVDHQSQRSEVDDFASYDGNVYSTLATSIVASEASPTTSRTYTLGEWQAATTSAGVARNLDPTARVGAPLSRYARGLLSANAIPGLTSAGGGWSTNVAGDSAVVGAACGPKGTPCLAYGAPASSNGFISSPRFGLTQSTWYRVSFDAMVSSTSGRVNVQVLRSGTPYDNLMGSVPLQFSGKTSWARYAFYFQATASVAAPSAGGVGARLDFQDVAPGTTLTFANVEITPVAVGGVDLYNTTLINGERTAQDFACPLASTSAPSCAKFFTFPAGQRVTWPLTIPGLKAVMLFTQDDSLPDSDGDGIADSQDACPGTGAGLAVNARGCAITQ